MPSPNFNPPCLISPPPVPTTYPSGPCESGAIDAAHALPPSLNAKALARLRGAIVRRNYRIQHVGNGIIKGYARGNHNTLTRIGLSSVSPEDASARRSELNWLSIPRARFEIMVRAPTDESLCNPVQIRPELLDLPLPNSGIATAYINGSFFNYMRQADAELPECAPIGQMVCQGKPVRSIAPLKQYQQDYHRFDGDDDSSLMLAPLLSSQGRVEFSEGVAKDERFSIALTNSHWRPKISPGSLQHAHLRNPRAAISIPATAIEGNVRLIAGLARDRNADPLAGYTLPEWARVCSRMDRLGLAGTDRPPNTSLNLDGGNSVALGAMLPGGRRVCISQTPGGRPVANIIALVERA